jgi:tRNA-specific adenosine deaminase 2
MPRQPLTLRVQFLDLTLSRNLNEPHTHEPYSLIFERGVDPHMDDGEEEGSPAAPANVDTIEINGKQVYCHAHSKVPDKDEDWPTLQELL